MEKRKIEEILNEVNEAIRMANMTHEELAKVSESLRMINDDSMDATWVSGYMLGTLEVVKEKLLEELKNGNK